MTVPQDLRSLGKALDGASPIDPAVVQGIRQASRSTNVDFAFLMAEAAQESGMKPTAKAATSSATGLFQFTETTWLDLVRQHGAKYGIGALADAVSVDASGRPVVADPAQRAAILALRTDPRLSADLAGELANSNRQEVERHLGRAASGTDLYLAHFLGAGGATEFLKAMQQNAATPAAQILPDAAAANRAVFYDGRTGAARSVADLYRSFAERLGAAGPAPVPAAAPARAATAVPALSPLLSLASLGGAPDGPVATLFASMVLSALKLFGNRPTQHGQG